MADETTSFSKGCFLFKNSQTLSPRKRPYFKPDDLYAEVAGESSAFRKMRLKHYKECWDAMHADIQNLQSDMNKKIFQDLLMFIKSGWHKTAGVIHEIPTAALITGVNMPDHEVIFSQLITELRDSVTPHIALLKSKDCTAMKFLMRNVIARLMGTVPQLDSDDDDMVDQPVTKLNARQSLTMRDLLAWYKSKQRLKTPSKKKKTPKKRETSEPQEPELENAPLVIVFEDFESFNASILQDFITICSHYIDQLPIVLVFGVATTVNAVHQILHHGVTSCLCIEKFQAEPSLTCLLEIIAKVLMTANFPFKLGHKVFRFLYENFLYHDFSLQNFIRSLKFCVMEHFYRTPLSVLCAVEKVQQCEMVSEFSAEQMEEVRKLMSFRRFVEGRPITEHEDLILDDDYTKSVVSSLLQELQTYHACFFPVLECLHSLAKSLPGHPLGKRVRDVYELCLASDIFSQDSYKQTLQLLRMLSRDDLLPALQSCVQILTDSVTGDNECQTLAEEVDALIQLISQFDDLQEQASALSSEPVKQLPIMSRFELQERLKSAVKQQKRESPFEKLRKESIDSLDSLFRRFLQCPQNKPLYEIFYYDDIQEIREHIDGCPRLAIQTALANPHHYLQCQCCSCDIGTIQDTMPDICVAYKLHLECGRLINLYDWLQAFTMVLEVQPGPSKTPKSKSKKSKKSDNELQARFIRSVSELQFLGFIKSTRRKTDHVARLTWGVC